MDADNPLVLISFFTSVGFITLNNILGNLDFELFQLIFLILINFLLFCGIKSNLMRDLEFGNYCLFYVLFTFSLPIFMLLGYGWRQGIAIGLYLVVRKGKNIDLLSMIVIALFFHLSILLIFVPELISRLKIRNTVVVILASLSFGYLFFNYAPIYGDPHQKSLSGLAFLMIFLILLVPVANDISIASRPVFIFSLAFILYGLVHGVADLEMMRVIPVLFIFLLIEIRKLSIYGLMSLGLANYLFASFVVRRLILDGGI